MMAKVWIKERRYILKKFVVLYAFLLAYAESHGFARGALALKVVQNTA